MSENAPPQQITLPDVIRDVFRNFTGFAEEHLSRPQPPSLPILVWLLGMDAVAGAMELEYLQQGRYLVDNWFHTWLRIMGMGIILGTVRYWFVGTVFHGIVRLAGGSGPMRTSRYIFLYSAIPVVVVDLLLKVFQMLYYGNGYFMGQTNATVDAVTGGIMLGAYLYTARLAYTGMRVLMGADWLRSILLVAAIAVAMVAAVVVLAN